MQAKTDNTIISGRAWVFGENIDTDQILPGYAMAEPFDRLGQFAMAGSGIPDFASRVQMGDIIVGGTNFGCGSSREQAPLALQQAGVALVVAVSFARIFRRNAINIGIPVMVADLCGRIENGERLEVDLNTGRASLKNDTVQGIPLSSNALATLSAGGLINRVKLELGR